jgi:RNA polymerase sigma-70 factor (ECF subfamily)
MDREPDWSWWYEARAVARRYARGASDAADDLAQELALAAIERGGTAARRPAAWLERVGRNAAIDRWRVERRRRELVAEISGPAPACDPEARVLSRERRAMVRGALSSLPRPLRRAALARFHAELPFDAVASRLHTEPVTARTRVHRALGQLRARVAGLRAFWGWFPGAQATVLGVTTLVAVAPPAARPPEVPAAAVVTRARVVARAPAHSVAPPPPAPAAKARVVARPSRHVEAQPAPAVQRFSFDDDEITSVGARPDLEDVVGAPPTGQPSLVELRWSLVAELLESLEDL